MRSFFGKLSDCDGMFDAIFGVADSNNDDLRDRLAGVSAGAGGDGAVLTGKEASVGVGVGVVLSCSTTAGSGEAVGTATGGGVCSNASCNASSFWLYSGAEAFSCSGVSWRGFDSVDSPSSADKLGVVKLPSDENCRVKKRVDALAVTSSEEEERVEREGDVVP